MKVIIIGAGEVGYHISNFFSKEGIDVTVIDADGKKIKRITEELDVAAIEGEGGSPLVLKQAGIDEAEMLLAVTDSDETNMIACLMVKAMFNIPKKIARIRNSEYFNNQVLLNKDNLDISHVINPEIESARAIIRLLKVPSSTVVEDFEDGLIKVIGIKVPKGSKLIGKSLIELRKEFKEDFLIGIIQHNDGNVIIPSGESKILENDIIYLPIQS